MLSINQFQEVPVQDYVELFNDDFVPHIPPYTNRGGIEINDCFVTHSNLTPSTPINCIIDYLTVVFNIDELHSQRKFSAPDLLHKTIDDEISALIIKLTDFIPDLLACKDSKGLFGYTDAYSLTRGNQSAGKLAFGGSQRGTCMVSLSGRGCSGVNMPKFSEFLETLPSAHITRCDIARDDLEGKLSVNDYVAKYKNGDFHTKGMQPSNKHITSSGGEGDTLYVGKMKNGKEVCIYEKGKQLGDKNSPWVRVEVRFSNVDRIIPFFMLRSPDTFFAASYPPLFDFSYFHDRLQVIKKMAEISFESLTNYASMSYGKLINVMLEIGRTPEQIVQVLRRDGCPKRLEMPYLPAT